MDIIQILSAVYSILEQLGLVVFIQAAFLMMLVGSFVAMIKRLRE
jgi:hypothetical protein